MRAISPSPSPSPALPPYEIPHIFEQANFWRPGAPLYIRPVSDVVRGLPLAHRAMLSRLCVPLGPPAVITLEGDGPPTRYLVGWDKDDLLHWHIARRHSRA